jgi:hypothetical protein
LSEADGSLFKFDEASTLFLELLLGSCLAERKSNISTSSQNGVLKRNKYQILILDQYDYEKKYLVHEGLRRGLEPLLIEVLLLLLPVAYLVLRLSEKPLASPLTDTRSNYRIFIEFLVTILISYVAA